MYRFAKYLLLAISVFAYGCLDVMPGQDRATAGLASSQENHSAVSGFPASRIYVTPDAVLYSSRRDAWEVIEDAAILDAEECVPDCEDRECGRDPVCDESCGRCNPGWWCASAGTCLRDNTTKWHDQIIELHPDTVSEDGLFMFLSDDMDLDFSDGRAIISGEFEGQIGTAGFSMGNYAYSVDWSGFAVSVYVVFPDNIDQLGLWDEALFELDFYDPSDPMWGSMVSIHQDNIGGLCLELCNYEKPTYENWVCVHSSVERARGTLTFALQPATRNIWVKFRDHLLKLDDSPIKNGFVFRFAGYLKDRCNPHKNPIEGEYRLELGTIEFDESPIEDPPWEFDPGEYPRLDYNFKFDTFLRPSRHRGILDMDRFDTPAGM